jgi:hypothetical protein
MYTAGWGSYGCLYDNFVSYDDYADTVRVAAVILDLDDAQQRELYATGTLALGSEYGEDYVEIVADAS